MANPEKILVEKRTIRDMGRIEKLKVQDRKRKCFFCRIVKGYPTSQMKAFVSKTPIKVNLETEEYQKIYVCKGCLREGIIDDLCKENVALEDNIALFKNRRHLI